MKGKRIGAFCLTLLIVLWIPLQALAVEWDGEFVEDPVLDPAFPNAIAVCDEPPLTELPGENNASVPENDGDAAAIPAAEPQMEELPGTVRFQAKLFQCGNLDGKQTLPGEAALFAEDELYNVIYKGLQDRAKTIDVSSFRLETPPAKPEEPEKPESPGLLTLRNTYERVVNDHPELFYVSKGYNLALNHEIYISILPDYYENLVTEEAGLEFDKAVEKVLAQIDPRMTPLEKTIALHDYLAINCAYNEDVGNDQSYTPDTLGDGSPWTAYGALVNGNPVCEGYSLAYKYLLDQVKEDDNNIECIIVASEEMNHAWNLVNLDGEWYHVDVTWDDPFPDVVGQCLYSNFLKSDTGIARTGHEGWSSLYECTSTDYESGYTFKGLTSPMHWYDGENYYISNGFGDLNDPDTPEYEYGPDEPERYNIYTGLTEEDSKQVGSIELFVNMSEGEYYFHNFGIIWRKDSLYYVNPDKDIVRFSLSDSEHEETKLGKVEFTPAEVLIPTEDGEEFTERWDTICLRYKDGKIQAVSKVTLDILAEFSVHGDVNKDGNVTKEDWEFVAKYLANWKDFTAETVDLTAADVNEDGSVTSVDRMILARHLAGWDGYKKLPYTPVAEAQRYDLISDTPVIRVSNAAVQADGMAAVAVSLEKNPGIASMLLNISFDKDALTLVDVKDAGVLGTEMHSDNKDGSSYTLSWANDTAVDNFTEDETIVTLYFSLNEEAAEDSYLVEVDYVPENDEILDVDMNRVSFEVVNGRIYKDAFSLGEIQAEDTALRIPFVCLGEGEELAAAFYNRDRFLGIVKGAVSDVGECLIENPYPAATRVSAMLLDSEWRPLCEKGEAELTELPE